MSPSDIKYKGPVHFTYERGFQQVAPAPVYNVHGAGSDESTEGKAHYVDPVAVPLPTSVKANEYGVFYEHTFPTLLNGTNAPGGPPSWYEKESKVDVLICGAGPSGLQVAISLLRQGCTFRIVDKSEGPLVAGRADSVQPRYLETLEHWGLATDVAVRGVVIERTAIWKDGRKLVFRNSHMSDSRYRGLDVTSQNEIEQIYLRDLLRHRKIVERRTSVKEFTVSDDPSAEYPVTATLIDQVTGATEVVRAKHLVGSDGASSTIRKQLGFKFEGVSTDIYWGIMDCVFESDYPHFGIFGCMVNSEWGGCVMIPREDGMIRLYTQIDQNRVVNRDKLAEGGAMDIGSITPEEVLAQANRIFAPFTIKFASPLSWFAIWKISERVSERYSFKNRVHLAGDACHVHSVMGAFGLNASILDSANLGWKLGLTCTGKAAVETLMPTYEEERRRHAERIIELTGTYLRFVCASNMPTVKLGGVGTAPREDGPVPVVDEDPTIADPDKRYLAAFYANNMGFLLGIDCEYGHSVLTPPRAKANPLAVSAERATLVRWGVRAPNPRVALGRTSTGYLYDLLGRGAKFTLVVFASDLQGPVLPAVVAFAAHVASPNSFWARWGTDMLELVLVTKLLPADLDAFLAQDSAEARAVQGLHDIARVAFDDELPEKDAHHVYGVDHARGAVAVVRPDLWTGVTVHPEEGAALDAYFGGFLL